MSELYDQADILRRHLRSLARRRFDFAAYDRRRMFPPHVVLELAPLGCFGLNAPPEIGGLGLPFEQMVLVQQELAAIDVTLAAFLGIHNALGVHPVLRHGSAAQRAGLARFVEGRAVLGFALTERGAGSDPKALATTARSVPGGYLLDGEKLWIGNAGWAQALVTVTRLADAGGRSVRYAAFLLPTDRDGVEIGAECATMGLRGIVQNAVRLRDVFVADAEMIGEAGQGLTVAASAMQVGRLGIAAIAIGAMRRALQLASDFAGRRRIAGRLLAERLQVRADLGAFADEIAMLDRALAFAARQLDLGEELPEQIPIALKVVASERAWHWTDYAMQLAGGRGYDEANLLPRLLRDVRILRIFEGPTEALQAYLGSTALYSFRALKRGFERLLSGNAALDDMLAETAAVRDETLAWIGDAAPEMAKPLVELAGLHVGDVLSWRICMLCGGVGSSDALPGGVERLARASRDRWREMMRHDWQAIATRDPASPPGETDPDPGPPAFGSTGGFLATDPLFGAADAADAAGAA